MDDPHIGSLRLSGLFRAEPNANTAVVVVHGLGGDAVSAYCVRTAVAVSRVGWSCLRVALRGADGRGEDVYHAGLADDLDAVVRSRALADYDHIAVIGYSLGGHVALHYGLRPDPRVKAIVAVGSPLDLTASGVAIDRRRAMAYRAVVLSSLKRAYRAVAARRSVPTPVDVVDRVQTLKKWDELVVVPRYGFESVEQYHRSMSVGPELNNLRTPTLYVGAQHDPMVPAWTVEPSLRAAGAPLVAHMLKRGGHVGFPRVSFAGAPSSIEEQVVRWLQTVIG